MVVPGFRQSELLPGCAGCASRPSLRRARARRRCRRSSNPRPSAPAPRVRAALRSASGSSPRRALTSVCTRPGSTTDPPAAIRCSELDEFVHVQDAPLEQVADPIARREQVRRLLDLDMRESTRMPVSGNSLRNVCAATRPSVECVGGIRTSTMTSSGSCSRTRRQEPRSRARARACHRRRSNAAHALEGRPRSGTDDPQRVSGDRILVLSAVSRSRRRRTCSQQAIGSATCSRGASWTSTIRQLAATDRGADPSSIRVSSRRSSSSAGR